jgi:glutamate/tyrosine decarboxylase-like PLP-dependent enzyme
MSKSCYPSEVALKCFFLGPQAENGEWIQDQMQVILKEWFNWRRSAFPDDGRAISEADLHLPEFLQRRKNCEGLLQEILFRFHQEIPKFSPRYIGHMFSEISLPALLGHLISLVHNPNNISGEASRVGIVLEEEAISFLQEMVNFPIESVGHFTSGGTLANFEALSRSIERTSQWLHLGATLHKLDKGKLTLQEAAGLGWQRAESYLQDKSVVDELLSSARKWSNPHLRAKIIQQSYGVEYQGPVILVPEHKHYSWVKGAALFGIGEEGLWPIKLNRSGHLDVTSLQELITKADQENRPICLSVSVAGTTELGFIDPIDQIHPILKQRHIWHHIDAAYGGFFCTLIDSEILNTESHQALRAIGQADSITLDPHKLGYVPYASGTFLCASAKNYYLKAYSGPYIQIKEKQDKGPFTLEGSRSAAGAVATWLTAKSIGLNSEGYGTLLSRTVRAKRDLENLLRDLDPRIRIAPFADSNILGFVVAHQGDSYHQASERTLKLYQQLNNSPEQKFFISKTKLTLKCYDEYLKEFGVIWQASGNSADLDLIRLCIMNPFFDSKELNSNFKEEFCRFVKSAMP